jgi:hypothetical protein
MSLIVDLGNWIYNYSTDFCINMSYILSIDYVTFGSLFFGFFMNGVILFLVILNIVFTLKKNRLKPN